MLTVRQNRARRTSCGPNEAEAIARAARADRQHVRSGLEDEKAQSPDPAHGRRPAPPRGGSTSSSDWHAHGALDRARSRRRSARGPPWAVAEPEPQRLPIGRPSSPRA
eukprot:15200663-Alexandrium_andersonii.AAC.1